MALNAMMQHLAFTLDEKDQALNSLHELNKSLEERLAQRTLELERSETRMRSIFDSVGEGILILNARGYVMSMNPAAERMFAVQSQDTEGIHSALLLAEVHTTALASLQSYDESKDSVFQISSGITPVEYQGRGFNGREFPMELIVTAIQQGEEVFRVCVIRDITRRYAAHKSGMAEMAIGVLHNVGNILNSVMLSGEEIARMANNSKVAGLHKANELLRSNAHDLGSFFTTNDKGKMLPQYYEKIGLALSEETRLIRSEVAKLNEKLAMMKDVIARQQAYARVDTHMDRLNVTTVIEDALRLQEVSLHTLGVNVRKHFTPTPPCNLHKSKFLQVLTNLIKNAKEATAENDQFNRVREIVIETDCIESGDVFIRITDNGCGITAENLQRIFNHGFTTKENGHGFGLHTSVLAMTDMGGTLRVHSDGPGHGTTFTLLVRAGQEKTKSTSTTAASPSSSA